MTDRPIDRLVVLAAKNYCDGVREEPRIWFDQIPLDFSTLSTDDGTFNTDSDAYINGERFPVRITHMLVSLGEQYDAETGALIIDPKLPMQLLEGVDLRVRKGDAYYMAEQFVAAPAWKTKVTANPIAFGDQGVSWTFDRPNILSARDTLIVTASALMDQVQLVTTGLDFTARLTVSFTGIGVQSRAPYFLSSSRTVTDSAPVQFDTADLQNAGSEPIALTDMTFQQSIEVDGGSTNEGSVRAFSIQVRQNGNGTNANWISTPKPVPPGVPLSRANASMLGLTAGPALVHAFPGDGWLVEPNQGFRVQARVRATAPSDIENTEIPVFVGFAGYIVVT